MMKRLLLGVFLSTLFAVPGMAQENFPWRSVEVFNFSDGLNDGADPTALSLGEASDLQNVVFTSSSAIEKRQGFSQINSTAISDSAVFTGLQFYKQADGDRFLVAAVSDGGTDRFYRMDYGAGTAGPDGTWDNISGGLSLLWGTDDHADFALAQDQVVIDDGVNTTAPYIWTGSGDVAALGGTPPNAQFVEYHKNHLWTAGNSAAPSRVQFSQLCNATTSPTCIENYTSTDTIDVETNDGQIIRGLKSGLDALYIFKDESIWRISGTDRDTFVLEQMVRGIGTLHDQSVVVINNQFVFVTSQGDIAVYDGGITVQILSTKIEGTLRNLAQDRLDELVATAFDDGTGDQDYYLCVSASGASTHNRVLVYDTHHKGWTKFTGITCNTIATYEIGSFQKAIMFGDYAGRANRYPNTEADAGSAINAYWQSGQWRIPELPLRKVFRVAQLYVGQEGSYNLTFTRRVDFEAAGTASTISLAGSGSLWDTAIYDADAYADLITTIGRVEINDGDYFFQWRVANANASEPFTMKGLRLWIEQTGRE